MSRLGPGFIPDKEVKAAKMRYKRSRTEISTVSSTVSAMDTRGENPKERSRSSFYVLEKIGMD